MRRRRRSLEVEIEADAESLGAEVGLPSCGRHLYAALGRRRCCFPRNISNTDLPLDAELLVQEIFRAGLSQHADILRVPVLRIAVEEHPADKGREVVHLQVFPDSGAHSDIDSVGVSAPYAYA